MSRYVLTPRAHDDLSEIWDYTAEIWRVEQADGYIRDLVVILEELARGERAGKAVPDIRAGYFRCTANKHFIFYTEEAEGIRIVRILHQHMDLPRHLRQ